MWGTWHCVHVYPHQQKISSVGNWRQDFSQDFRIGCPKIHIWSELGAHPIHFHLIAIASYTKNIHDMMSKISNRVSKKTNRHPDTPLAKALIGASTSLVEKA